VYARDFFGGREGGYGYGDVSLVLKKNSSTYMRLRKTKKNSFRHSLLQRFDPKQNDGTFRGEMDRFYGGS